MGYKQRIDMTGLRFGRLVGLFFDHKTPGGHACWRFACDCGCEVVADGTSVRRGGTTSCGCLHREISAERLTVHGRRAKCRHDATYRTWQLINDYCTNSASSGWKKHGALGVSVCPAWRGDFARFVEEMGERPPGAHLVRHNERLPFERGNCRWAPVRSRSERARRTTVEPWAQAA